MRSSIQPLYYGLLSFHCDVCRVCHVILIEISAHPSIHPSMPTGSPSGAARPRRTRCTSSRQTSTARWATSSATWMPRTWCATTLCSCTGTWCRTSTSPRPCRSTSKARLLLWQRRLSHGTLDIAFICRLLLLDYVVPDSRFLYCYM